MEFQKRFSTEEACREHLFKLRWPEGYRCPRCGHDKYYFHKPRQLYQCRSCNYQASLTAGTVFHKTKVPLRKWFWMIFLMGRQKSGVSMLSIKRMLEIGSYKTVWMMGMKIRKALLERDSSYRLAGLLEIDDTYFGSKNSGKRGRGAQGKARVVLAVENRGENAGFAAMKRVKNLSGAEINQALKDRLGQAVITTDGWRAYGALSSDKIIHESVVVGSSEQASLLLPWVHTLISNIKGNIKGVYHGVSPKHLSRYLAEFCYRFNRRFWESQMFNRMLTACLSSATITFSELSE